MTEDDFEGTLILEKLAETNTVEAFFNAIDDDDFEKVRRLMLRAGIDLETIRIAMRKIVECDDSH